MLTARQLLEASLRSDSGEQRLGRAHASQLSRVALIPREPLGDAWAVMVEWVDGHFALVLTDGWRGRQPDRTNVALAGRPLGPGVYPLDSGQVFTVGATAITFTQVTRTWAADLAREGRLLADGRPEAWSVFTDELLAVGDPLGLLLAGHPERDVALALDVLPLEAQGLLTVARDARGAWSGLTFHCRLTAGELSLGAIDGVMRHPFAWFVREVTLDFRGPDHAELTGAVERAAAVVACAPWLEALVVPRGVQLAPPRPGVALATLGRARGG